jgi:hypothetical protein
LHIVNTKRADFDPEAFEDQYNLSRSKKRKRPAPAKVAKHPTIGFADYERRLQSMRRSRF